MLTTVESAGRISFGLFELDPQAGELWKAGFKVRLPGQPFKVLTVLLSRPGEVVTREELQAEVWGSHTVVDFERALAGAINKVREALGDSAENPRFIETLPKRGYRFIAPVSFGPPLSAATKAAGGSAGDVRAVSPNTTPWNVESPRAPVLVEAPAPVSGVSETAVVGRVGPLPETGQAWSRRERWLLGLIAACLLAMLAGIWAWRRQPGATPLKVVQITHESAISAGPPGVENLLAMGTDGNRIFTSVMENGRPRLATVSLGTGEVQTVNVPQELAVNSLTDVSRDGTRLLLRGYTSSASEQPLWVVPSAGGSALRVGDVLAHDAAWMPDGASVLYANGNDLAVIRLDNGVSTPFARLDGRAFWMRWSPDGRLLRFTLLDPVTHSSSLWELERQGGAARRLQAAEVDRLSACCGSWTADGAAYVFEADENIWELKGSGLGATLSQLTNGPLRLLSPLPARLGSRIYFIGLDQHSGLQRFTPDGSFRPAPSFLTNATRVEYSRDGAWVAWVDNKEQLWRARAADGGDKLQLIPEYFEAFMARWSPDGSRLAVMARQRGKLWQTYLVNAAGGTLEPLLPEERNQADPSWSPDGQQLVFGREPDPMGRESGSRALQILDLQTRQTRVVPGSEGLFSPRWSPDGRWIAALTLDQKSLMLFDVARQQWKQLAATSAADPVWTADSKAIYVHAFLAEGQPLLRVGVPDGGIHAVADLTHFHAREIANYFFGGLTPANEPLVKPRVGTGDLYTLDLAEK